MFNSPFLLRSSKETEKLKLIHRQINDTEANAADRSVRACDIMRSAQVKIVNNVRRVKEVQHF